MTKPDPALLDPARYPFSCLIPTRYGDLDPNCHLNNVALVRILEDARLRMHHACKPGSTFLDWQIMAASFTLEYLGQGYYPDPVAVSSAFTGIGRSSFRMAQVAFQQDRPIAYSDTVLVWVEADRPAPIPDAFRSALQTYMMRA